MEIAGNGAGALGETELKQALWPHQQAALGAFERDQARGDTATYLVVPPGGGKTLIGLEAARRLGRPTVVLCPNTAIQGQWITQWHTAFSPVTVTATAKRELPTALSVLTYQALCTLGSTGNGDDPGDAPNGLSGRHMVVRGRSGRGATDGDGLLSMLHPNGMALVERLAVGGPWTVVLDECHHLLELWGQLLQAVLAKLDRPYVIGLTATPPQMMTAAQAELHRALFGEVDLEVSAPALVREGRLAPYQELAYFCRPVASEADYIHGEAIRFAELRTSLLDPGFASTPFLAWLQSRVVERHSQVSTSQEGAQVSWERFERDEPMLADAAVRLHMAGLLPLPDGARIREQHRHDPTAEDWVALIGDYCQRCLLPSADPRDGEALAAVRRALPSVGYRLTRAGVRPGDSPVDRVLARSASKAYAAAHILAAETAELGGRLRALVLCDHEQASGTPSADLAGILPAEAGGAQLVLDTLLGDAQAASLDPVLLTGRRVACGPATAQRLTAWLRAADPGLNPVTVSMPGQSGMVEVTSPRGWEARRYVPLVTRFFAEGGTHCLVGTRALLGEGWDAPAVNVVIDLTVATTPTSVVQARGRALRLDHTWPAKVADNWGVVCVTSSHPKGTADYARFVRKHDRYFALSPMGDIASGVAHIDPRLSPYSPPPEDGFDGLNSDMLTRTAERETSRDRWAIGTPYEDMPVATVTVTSRRSLGLPSQFTVRLTQRPPRAWWGTATLAAGVTAVAALTEPPAVPAVIGAAAVLGGLTVLHRSSARLAAVSGHGSLDDLAAATADALHDAGLTSRGADAIMVEAQADGSYRARLQDVTASESALFADALEETLSPLAQPRYIVARLIITPPRGLRAAAGLAARRLIAGHVPATVVYHAVPSALSSNKKLATIFERAWNTHVSPGKALYTGSPEGAGALAAQRGDDPFALTTQIRTLWR
ncbi:MAG TPA: DEAD/DEAH box helicase family protein [Streptosporangiaceae bacterium]|nr:DEAD/DEAH box helicase family protein [Streptosporangiaceae bacterium]